MKEPKDQVFISYAKEDKEFAEKLHNDLQKKGISVWWDKKRLLAGQDWQVMIRKAIKNSHYFLSLISSNSINKKKGYAQKELKIALELYEESEIEIIPVILDDSKLTDSRINKFQWVALGSSYNEGVNKILRDVRKVKTSKLIKGNIFNVKISHYIKALSKMEILPHVMWADNIKIQHSNLRDIYFQQINRREAVRGKTYSFKEIKNRIINKNSSILFIGEAGIGKTTICRWFTKEIAAISIKDNNTKNRVIPILISLRELSSHEVEEFTSIKIPEFKMSLRELVNKFHVNKIRLVIFLDGLNEIEEHKRELVISQIYNFQKNNDFDISIIYTSRSVGISEKLCSLFGDTISIFEIQRWDEKQLNKYFIENNIDTTFFNRLSGEMKRSLQLPLFAWLFIQAHRNPLSKPIKTIGDIFNSFIENWLQPVEHASEKFQNIKKDYQLTLKEKKEVIYKFAFVMTKKNLVVTACNELEKCLPVNKKDNFKFLALDLINSGILKCVEEATLDIGINISKLKSTKIMFLHQAFQEFLTAEFISNKYKKNKIFPDNLSDDAFWRDVPIYVMRSIDQSSKVGRDKVINFVNSFLDSQTPDFWTAARLIHEINTLDQNKIRVKIINRLIHNLSLEICYAYTIEAFSELQEFGRQGLLNQIKNTNYFKTIFAKSESHLHSEKEIESASKISHREAKWRSLGRPITILGELGETRFINLILDYIDQIQSRHLVYHVLESFLLIIRIEPNNKILYSEIVKKLYALDWLSHDDPIIEAYTTIIIKEVFPETQINVARISRKLIDFLKDKAKISNPHFEDEFWQRAHGILILPEIVDISDSLDLMSEFFHMENQSIYKKGKLRGYIAVHSAILTSIIRLDSRSKVGFEKMQNLLVAVFQSKRLKENIWAYRWLENLLLMICTENEKEWLHSLSNSHKLSEETKRIIRNVTYILTR